MPAWAWKVTSDCNVPSASSLVATKTRFAKVVPVYTPSNVSKLLPAVEIVTGPVRGARHCHHTDLPPELPAMVGSLVSFVALRFEDRTLMFSDMTGGG